jgi:acyl-CoA synthetase (AMP-forming)/AMP-acid ligase II
MVNMLVNNPLLPLLDLTSLRLVSCGGSPQSPQVIAQAVAAFGCEFFVSYGMTECCGKISMSLLPWREGWWVQVGLDRAWQQVNTSGRPFLLMEVRGCGPRQGGARQSSRCVYTRACVTVVGKGIAARSSGALLLGALFPPDL